MTAKQQLIQLPASSRAILEAAALLNQPFSLPLLIDLGFSADALDPLFDNGIFRESFATRAEFTDSELRNDLLGRMPWSKKRRFCEQVGELLRHRRDTLDEAADFFCRAHRYGDARVCRVQAAAEACQSGQYIKAFRLLQQALEIWPTGEDVDNRSHALKEMARCARHAREFGAARLAWEEIMASCRETFCRRQGTVSEEHLCLGCLSFVLFRTGQWRSAIENARKVLANEDAHPVARGFVAVVAAMIGVLRGERRRENARLTEALLQLRANNFLILEFFPLWVRGVMADLEANHPLAAEQYRELLSLWHGTEDRMFAVPGVVSAAGFYADQRDGKNLAACCEILSVMVTPSC